MPAEFDVVIIGGGHNGLVNAAYLAKAGLSVIVLERRSILGGCCATEELWPGFKLSTASYTCGLLRPKIISDLELTRFGLEQHYFEPADFVPFPDGKHIFLWNDTEKTLKEIAKFSEKDARRYAEFEKFWGDVIDLIDAALLAPPPPLTDLLSLLKGPEGEELIRRLMLSSAKDILDEYFESDYVKAAFCGSSIIGTAAGPMKPGTAFVLAHHLIGEIDGVKGVWGWARGGMGGISAAIAKCAQHYGALIKTDADVDRILVNQGRAKGVRLRTGEEINCRVVSSNADPKRTFLKLVGEENLDNDFANKIRRYRSEGTCFKVNCAISELPDWKAVPGKSIGPQHTGSIEICPSMEYLERAYDDAKYGKWSAQPYMNIMIQSAVDNTVAPSGKHTMSIFAQHAPYKLRDGSWEQEREKLGNNAIEILAEYAPNIRKAVIHQEVLTPVDLEQRFNITGGHIFHGELTPDQILSFRPIPGWSHYRTPIVGLYLCGSGTHPGGAVTGAPGHNAAQTILEELKSGVR